ncbi:hypothetical protein TNCV_1145071 [Trichonephila clavipes]|nr:hypothetical protein TNCV_1145071 [Trichonephila clavipes]
MDKPALKIKGNHSETIDRRSLTADDQSIRVWRRPGHWYHPVFVVESDTATTEGVTGSPRYHLSARQHSSTIFVTSPAMSSRIYDVLPWPSRSREISPIEPV